MGCVFASLCIILLDVDGAFIALLLHRIFCLILVCISAESKGWEREITVTGSPCYLKSLYYAMYLWPQGSAQWVDMLTYMAYDRQHMRASVAGQAPLRIANGRMMSIFLYSCLWKWMHLPTIAIIFFLNLLTANPLYASLCMEWFNLYRVSEGFETYWLFISAYPAFVGQYLEVEGVVVFLSFCESLRSLGTFLAILRWPGQLHCGDPMNCWRSQYLYSHAIFYNCGGDQGNITYVIWYCFAKSQKRQCCCPYRKLKPDAPEKCCPPCCSGPLVEESGGCPCPCCCASCSA